MPGSTIEFENGGVTYGVQCVGVASEPAGAEIAGPNATQAWLWRTHKFEQAALLRNEKYPTAPTFDTNPPLFAKLMCYLVPQFLLE